MFIKYFERVGLPVVSILSFEGNINSNAIGISIFSCQEILIFNHDKTNIIHSSIEILCRNLALF